MEPKNSGDKFVAQFNNKIYTVNFFFSENGLKYDSLEKAKSMFKNLIWHSV